MKVAVVVGGTGDIGQAICRQLLADGMRVVVTGITTEQAEDACESLGGNASNAFFEVLDVTDPDTCKASVASIVEKQGRLDCLVNCAGVSYIAPVLLAKKDEWQRVMDVNTIGAFSISQAVLRPMIRQKHGRIVHIGSISSEVGAPYNAIYSASKAAIGGLVRSLALEVAGAGITVNGVQPGYVKTKLFRQTQGARAKLKGVSLDEHEKDLVDDTPTGILVSPEDVANAVSFLASEGSKSVTGQLLNVDGGRTAK